MTVYSTQLLVKNERSLQQIMQEWNNLQKYFGSQFKDITYLKVILYLEKPLIVTFKSENQYYIGYLYKFNDENFNAYWLISKTSRNHILKLIDGKTSVKDTIQKEQTGYYFSVVSGNSSLSEKKISDFDINSDFYINNNTPNELELQNVRDSIMYEPLKANIEAFKEEINQQYAPDGKVAVKDVGTYQENIDAAQVLLDSIKDNENWDVAQEEYNKLTDMAKVKQAIAAIIHDGGIIPEWQAEEQDYATMVLDAIEIM